ncbi:MAG: hypothetical protein A2W90_13990 [Bacteroidetes bacterium GWF2_42_66]|nr:MAG: hypothetical protein A2W92_14705 [Bacteroidetes bacterium GWA2_42_15]OFX97360.1 MAG: hypothetical protein A2W89_01165 [Bacteroidetes bacterium GWE2_42_39]OFY39997.1 MAG: hypothetical protein A2W90_13990 [Bacteroidetes bacterium GWF2_42_66]HBL78193.1 hypothetical protein [Prolixibacteraceae bacterium]HCR89450.1 hypothetical protein [Prolixibacteraceae bacterium]
MSEEINDVYLKVDNMFKLKLKSQIKGSGLSFDSFLLVNDLITEREYYVLIINSEGIYFNNLNELYSGMIEIIKKELVKIKNDVNSYIYHKSNDLKCNETFIYNELDSLGYREDKLFKILEKINSKTEK